ncbi:MAG: T9SS type A sorting domain-containing protein [Bacteroidetes bacterium]|nr:T9SS type A sorting domain-containing protein [Bacteroidota bacterium]
MKAILLVSGLILFSPFAFSQKEANNWVLGYNVGVSWNSGAPVAVPGAVMNQNEGLASISDAAGQLLFYTDGVTVRNRQHQVMMNGTGLKGNFSSTQSALIVPQPGSNGLYYIFTTDADGGANGLNYSTVDMTQDGGMGAVTDKNVLLYSPSCEKLTATRHANGRDIWLISHRWNSSSFYAYLVTASGIQLNPVVTNVGAVHAFSNGHANQSYGYMKASPDGTKLAVAVWGVGGWLDILNFNNQTGVPAQFITDNTYNEHGPYGVEFSPNSRLLYASEMNYMDSSHLFQYDLMAGSSVAVIASRTTIARGMTYDNCGMQLAVDGKIYITSYPQHWLNVIQQPDVPGTACSYQAKGFTWSGSSYTQLGLPNFITSYFGVKVKLNVTVTVDKIPCNNPCEGRAQVSVSNGLAPYQYTWQPGNHSGSVVNGLCAGNYSVTVQDATGLSSVVSVSLINAVPVPVEIRTENKSICANDTALICATSGYDSYRWSNGGTNVCIQSGMAGNYQVTATDHYGCSATSNHLNITVIPPPAMSVSVDGNKIYTVMRSNYQWYLDGVIINGANSNELEVKSPGYYWLEVKDTNGCVATSAPVYFTSTNDQRAEESDLRIFPNPVSGVFVQLSVDHRLVGSLIEVFDNLGRQIAAYQIQTAESEFIAPLQKGVYLVRINSPQGAVSRRLVRL